MDRTLKERYKYTPLSRLAAPLGTGGGDPGPVFAEIEIQANACLCRKAVATSEELEQTIAASEKHLAEDPLVADNLGTPDNRAQGIQIDIPDNFRADGVLYVHLRYPGNGGKCVLRNTVRIGRNAQVRIALYQHPATCPDRTVINALTVVDAAAGAQAEIIEVAETQATCFGTILNRQRGDSHVKVTTIDLDNALLRRNQFIYLTEQGAECDLEGVYITDGTQHCDNHIRMYHAVPHCTSNQLFKGVAEDESHAVFTGQIHVAKNAQQTVALQENHNIVLSDKAKIDTRPQLEIYADDVKCNHGATIGRLDPEAIYYMRQRGIGLEVARRLQIEGFIDEIIDHSHIEDLGHLLHEKVSRRLLNI